MATIIDALLVTLGLDAAGMKEGAHDASAAYEKMVEDAKKASREFQAQMDADAAAFKRKQKAEEQAYKESQESVKVSAKERAKGLANFKNEQSVEAEMFRKAQKEKSLAFKDAQELQVKKFKEQQSEEKKSADGMSYLNGKILGVIAAFVGLDALKNFTERLVDADTHVKRTSGALDLAAENLNAWQMAAAKSGASAEDVEGAFRAVNKFQEDIAKGNPAAIAKLTEFAQTIQGLNSIRPGNKQIVFDVQKLTDKSLPAEERMLEISKILSQLSEKDAALAAEKLGISEDVSRFLRQGSDEVQKSLDSAKELDPAFKKAADDSLILSRQWTDIKQEIKGASDSLLVDMFPAIKAIGDIVKGFAEDWNAILSGKGGEKLKGPAQIQYDAAGNPTGVSLDDDSDTKSSGISDAEIAAMKARNDAIMRGDGTGKFDSFALPKSAIKIPQVKNQSSFIQDLEQLQSLGWTREQAIGILANVQRESHGNDRAIGDSGHAFGLAQWHEDRQENFKKFAGKDIRDSTHAEQVAFIDYELRKGSEQAAGNALKKSSDAAEAASIISKKYERPRDADGEAQKRADTAKMLLSGMPMDKSVNTGASAAVASNQTTNNTQSSNATHVETHIGNVQVNAPNAKTNGDVADAIGDRLGSYAFASNANSGL